MPWLYGLLAQYQATHPTVSLVQMLNGDAPGGEDATAALYATSGLIVDSVFRESGIAGLRRFAQVRGSPDDIVKVLPEHIHGTGGNVDRWWRSETQRALGR
mgnify:CR=1 FL=1